MLVFSWDNGVLAFVLSLVLFTLVLLLALAVALRDALLSVLIVLLPLFTIVYPIPSLAPLTRRAWLLFGELAFLPWVLIVPLELAVGAGSAPLLVGYLAGAVASPALLALGGAQLSSLGFPSAGSTVAGATQRGLSVAASTAGSSFEPFARSGGASPTAGQVVRGAARTATATSLPLAVPIFSSQLLGHGAARVFRHLPDLTRRDGAVRSPYYQFPAVRPRTGGGR
jgi:hypothetical protein